MADGETEGKRTAYSQEVMGRRLDLGLGPLCVLPAPLLGPILVAQTVKNLLAVQETQVQSLGQADPLEKAIGYRL